MSCRFAFKKAIELDPQYAAAYTYLGWTYWLELTSQWSQDPEALEQVFALARKAVALDESLPLAHRALGLVYMREKQHERAMVEAERAFALAPNNADSYMALAATWPEGR